MSDQNGDGPHKTAAVLPPPGRPFAPGYDARRNGGRRPRGLAALVRQAVGDGQDLVRFFRAIFAGDSAAIGERRRISLRDRMLAGEWFAARGWDRAPVVVELPDAPAALFTPEQTTAIKEMPEDLKQQIREWLNARREEYLAERRAEAEARMRSYLPDPADGNERQSTGASDAQPERLPTE